MENPELKQDIEKINKEGWEDNAAVRIGKKEDMPNMVKALETEGKAEDVATYIRLNKQIIVPAEDVKRLMGSYGFDKEDIGKFEYIQTDSALKMGIYFIDKDLNLAKVEIDIHKNKIGSLSEEAKLSSTDSRYLKLYNIKFKDELSQAGFKFSGFPVNAEDLISKYQRGIIDAAKEKTSREFDF